MRCTNGEVISSPSLTSGLGHNMIAMLCRINTSCDHLLRLPSGKGISGEFGSLVKDEVEEYDSKDKEYILCRQCRRIITTPAERIDVQGVHRHTFANPQGIIYEIGCFRAATGCVYAGPATTEWSWFAGYSWRVSVLGRV